MAMNFEQIWQYWEPAEGSRLDRAIRAAVEANGAVAAVTEERGRVAARQRQLEARVAAARWDEGPEGTAEIAAALAELPALAIVMKQITQEAGRRGKVANEARGRVAEIVEALKTKHAQSANAAARWKPDDPRAKTPARELQQARDFYLLPVAGEDGG
jgi:hypothetical protein